MMVANTSTEPVGQQRGRVSVVLAAVLVTAGISTMALTFTPTGSPPKVSQSSQAAVNGFDAASNGYSVTGEIDVSKAPPLTTAAPVLARMALTDLNPFVAQEPLSLGQYVLTNQDRLPAPNPASMAVVGYE